MIGSMPFYKKAEVMATNFGDAYNRRKLEDKKAAAYELLYGRNGGVRQSDSHPRYGFQTLLNQHSSGDLPTAPAVVGGNVMWNKAKVTPLTQHLHNSLSMGRPMNPPPALGSILRLGEPFVNSIHTTY